MEFSTSGAPLHPTHQSWAQTQKIHCIAPRQLRSLHQDSSEGGGKGECWGVVVVVGGSAVLSAPLGSLFFSRCLVWALLKGLGTCRKMALNGRFAQTDAVRTSWIMLALAWYPPTIISQLLTWSSIPSQLGPWWSQKNWDNQEHISDF
jgi:hypothetical protein